MSLLIVLATVRSLMVALVGSGSQARPLSDSGVEVSGARVENIYEINPGALATMLPKGPVPPSGPNPDINWFKLSLYGEKELKCQCSSCDTQVKVLLVLALDSYGSR